MFCHPALWPSIDSGTRRALPLHAHPTLETARPQKDSSLTPTVSVWVKPNSHLHRVALAAGAVSSQDDAPPAPLACPCCASAAKAPARAMSYKEAVTRGSGAEAPAPETTAASHVVSARETGVVATVANTAGARASRKHRCEVHVSWDNKMPRRGVSLGVSVSKEDVDVDVRVGRLDAEVDVARGPLGGDSEGAEGAKGAEGPEEDEGVNKEERAVRVTFGLWDGEGGERASFFKLLAARMEADRVDVPGEWLPGGGEMGTAR